MLHRLGRIAGLLLVAALAAPPARAADFYLSGSLVGSGGSGDSSGRTANINLITGSDTDSSLAYGASLGFGFELEEVLPENWKAWGTGLRFELEYLYGRSYELISDTRQPPPSNALTPNRFFDRIDVWTLMPQLWFDLPLRTPVSKVFGRTPILDPLTLSVGGAAGIAHVEIDGFDNVSEGIDTVYKFAYQANLALDYELTERTSVQLGYRYLDMGKVDGELVFAAVPTSSAGEIELDLIAHEFSAALRVNYFSRPLEELSPTKWFHLPKWGKPKRPKWTKGWRRPRWLGGRKGP